MIGICFELKTTCRHCSSPIMLNAYTEKILCHSCYKYNDFPEDEWKNLLEDAVKEAPKFGIGEGQPSTIMRGQYTYNLMYGRQDPRCSKCKTPIDITKMEEYSASGHVKCSKCANEIFVRKPSEMVTETFPDVMYLAGEDEDQMKINPEPGKLPASSKPVLFTCPSCAGNLEVDGTDRMISCKFCNSQIYLPDDLWFRLHPVKEVERWYMVINDNPVFVPGSKQSNKMPDWYYLADMISDRKGNTYFATAEDDEKDFIVWSIDKELNTRWVRKGLNYPHEHTQLAISGDGNLYLWNKNKHSLLKLSSEDGSTISKLEGDKQRVNLNMKGCSALISCSDGTLLTVINNVFARFTEDGTRVNLWSAKKFGLFSSGIGEPITESEADNEPYVRDMKSEPKLADGDYMYLIQGLDGYIYMMDRAANNGELAKFESSGIKIWSKTAPLGYKECRQCQDENGYIYIIGKDEKDNTTIVRFDTGTDKFVPIIKGLRDGGQLLEEDNIAVLPDGTILAARFYNILKVFSPSHEMIYRSDKAKEDDELELRTRREKVENDEEFED